MSVFFKGQQLISPTTASAIDDSAMRNQNLSVGNVVALLGSSGGGQPKTALSFGSPQEAQRSLVSGELLDAVLAAFNPSSETDGPSKVIALRVNPAVGSSLTLNDSTPAASIVLTSTGYGLGENDIKVKIEAGTTTGYKPTVQRGTTYYTIDNLTRNAFTLRYSGGQASAQATINGTTITLAAPTGTTVATIDMTLYSTIQQVVDRINQVSGFAAVVQDGNYSVAALQGLDYITGQDVKTATYTVKADLQALVDWFNSPREDLVTAARASNAGKPPAVSAFAYLSGGSNGTTTNQDWSDTFAVLQTIECQWITPVTSDPSIHAMADAHVQYMSTTARRERRAICGMPLGSTDTGAINAAKAINSDRTSLVHLGIYNYNAAGVLTLYPPYIAAALIAGGFAGVNPGTPLTNKSIRVQGLERNLRNPIDTDVLINGGVLCLENTDQGYKIVKSISTWLINSNYNRVEQSCGVALDFTARNVRQALDVLRGKKADALALSRAVSITETTLRELARAEPSGPGVLAGNLTNPAYRNISASIVGDVLRVQYECSPVVPINYVLVTIFAVPFSGTST